MGDGIAWHTPTIETGAFVVRTASVPVSLLSHVGGALGQLAEEYNWLQVGDPIADIISLVNDMIDSWYTQELIGAVMSFAGSIPPGWHLLDGTTLDGDLYPELAAAVPASWIAPITGDINLPSAEGMTIVGSGSTYTHGSTGGSATHTLTVAEIPAHDHTYTPPTLNLDLESPGVPDILGAGIGTPTTTGQAGGSEAHNNMPPYLALHLAIFTGRHYV